MNVMGPYELEVELVKARLDAARQDPIIIAWQKALDGGAEQNPSARELQVACYRLADALGRRDLFGLREEEYAGTLSADLVLLALRGGIIELVSLIEKWEGLSIPVDDRTYFEIVDDIEALLDSRIGFHSVQLIFQAGMLKFPEQSRERKICQGLCTVFESFLENLDVLMVDNRDILAIMATNNWCNSTARALPDAAWQPRPWWLTDDLYFAYDESRADSEMVPPVGMVPMEFVPSPASVRPRPSEAHEADLPTAFSVAAEGASEKKDWSSVALFKGRMEPEKGHFIEDYELRLKFEDEQSFDSVDAVRDLIGKTNKQIAVELSVIPHGRDDRSRSHEWVPRTYTLRFNRRLFDMPITWNREQLAYVTEEVLVDRAQLDLEKFAWLRRRE